MTLYEISQEYKKEADRFRRRIRQLRKERPAANERERFYLDRRIAHMTAVQREMRELADFLEHYYERGNANNVNHSL